MFPLAAYFFHWAAFPLHLLIGHGSREYYYYPEALCAPHAEERGHLRRR